MKTKNIPYLTWIIWSILGAATVLAAATQHWSHVFVIVTAFFLTLLPAIYSERFQIHLPLSFLAAISLFVFATLFLGEVFDFYNRYWWWDILLHGASAIAFGIIGFLFVFYLFQGDKYAAPPWALALISFCFAVSIGAIWEVFEYLVDQLLGMNMQKNGLSDTMGDIIVDMVGASIGAISGFLWIKGQTSGLTGMIDEFINMNLAGYRKLRWPSPLGRSETQQETDDCAPSDAPKAESSREM